jgi:hypothetical protein
MKMYILFKVILIHIALHKNSWIRYLKNNLKFAEEVLLLLANAETSAVISQLFHIANKFGILNLLRFRILQLILFTESEAIIIFKCMIVIA